MISIIGANFPFDLFAMEHMGTNRTTIKNASVTGGVFDKMYITLDFDAPYNPNYSLDWDLNTIMACDFDGNINGGNVNYTLSQLEAIRIKRKLPDDFDWITLNEIVLSGEKDLSISLFDNTNKNNTIYEYAMVPVTSIENGTEGDYVTAKVMSQFNGIFICQSDEIYKLYADVNFGSAEQVRKTGIYEPLGRKYPIVVSNALTNYYKGSLSGKLILDKDIETGKIDREAEIKYRKSFTDFVANSKAKIIKDYNGNMWLVMIVDNITISPINTLNYGIANIGFNFVEIGDASNQQDLMDAGIISG